MGAPRFSQSNVDGAPDVVPVTKSDTLDVWGRTISTLTGPSQHTKALLVGTAGTATLVMSTGETRTSVPLQQGYNPLWVVQVKNAGTAADIWAIPF